MIETGGSASESGAWEVIPGPVLLEKLCSGDCHANRGTPIEILDTHQPTFVCVLPHGKLRAGGAPRVHCFLVGSISEGEPLEQVKNQDFDAVDHGCPFDFIFNAPNDST